MTHELFFFNNDVFKLRLQPFDLLLQPLGVLLFARARVEATRLVRDVKL
jgi:hypothetical protein